MKSALTTKSRDEDRLRAAGRRIMRRSAVAICGLARDCAANLPSMIPQVEQLAAEFGDCRVIVVQNDSTDDTAGILARWRGRNPAVELVQFCYVSPPTSAQSPRSSDAGCFGAARMERMTFVRNQYLKQVAAGPAPDFVIVLDLDIKSYSLAGVQHSFGHADAWDIVTANGTRYSLRNPLVPAVYWDSYAYEPAEGFVGGVQTPRQIRSDQTRIARLLRNGHLLRARSAFGGLAIYRAELLVGHRYSVIANKHPQIPVLCDHPSLHRSMRREHSDLRLTINPMMQVRYGAALDLLGARLKQLMR